MDIAKIRGAGSKKIITVPAKSKLAVGDYIKLIKIEEIA